MVGKVKMEKIRVREEKKGCMRCFVVEKIRRKIKRKERKIRETTKK